MLTQWSILDYQRALRDLAHENGDAFAVYHNYLIVATPDQCSWRKADGSWCQQATEDRGHRLRVPPADALLGERARYAAAIDALPLCHRHWKMLGEEIAQFAREVSHEIARSQWESSKAERKRQARATQCVYVVRRNRDQHIKIGTSTQYRERMQALRREHGELETLLLFRGTHRGERLLHAKFADYRIPRTEWFEPADELLTWIADPVLDERLHPFLKLWEEG